MKKINEDGKDANGNERKFYRLNMKRKDEQNIEKRQMVMNTM